jgi:DNA-binding CsgD family transcriptional regulator
MRPSPKPIWIILIYAVLLGTGILLIRTLEVNLLLLRPSWQLYSGALAVIFLLLGIWLSGKLKQPGKVNQPHIPVATNAAKASDLGLSERELEVLRGMAEGLSNAEIGEKLFLSTHTVKSHASRLFEKMEVKRRTQAIQKGKMLGIIQ